MTIHLLRDGYALRLVDEPTCMAVFTERRRGYFPDDHDFRFREVFCEKELRLRKELHGRAGDLFRRHWLVEHDGAAVGWSFGRQEDAETYLMINTALDPAHRGKGVYSALLPLILADLSEAGFQVVRSTHKATNNAVIVPKLKAGFHITGLQLSDIFGTVVELRWYANPARRQVLRYRAGEALPPELAGHFGSL